MVQTDLILSLIKDRELLCEEIDRSRMVIDTLIEYINEKNLFDDMVKECTSIIGEFCGFDLPEGQTFEDFIGGKTYQPTCFLTYDEQGKIHVQKNNGPE